MKKNVTISYLQGVKPHRVVTNTGIPAFAPPGRSPSLRLTWGRSIENGSWSYSGLAKTINTSSLPNTLFFLDTCFITAHEVPEEVWAALRNHQVVLIPSVLKELYPGTGQSDFNKEFQAAISEEVATGSVPWLDIFDSAQLSWQFRYAHRYYTKLLFLRKCAFWFCHDKLKSKLNREPTKDELVQSVQKLVHDRGITMAAKAWEDGKSDTTKIKLPSTDEELVVAAVLMTIILGKEAVILTRDADLLEQFYKLIYIIDTHYRSTLLSMEYRRNPQMYPLQPIDPSWKRLKQLYVGSDDVLVSLPKGIDETVLPADFDMAHSYCFRITGSPNTLMLSKMSFNLEQQMRISLYTKAHSLGQNTSRFNGRNFHRCVDPLNMEMFGRHAIIARDQKQVVDGVTLSQVDIEMVMRRCEGVQHVTHPFSD